MILRFAVFVEVERDSGKFASKVEIGEMIRECLDDANPDEMYMENDAIYNITTWEVTDA